MIFPVPLMSQVTSHSLHGNATVCHLQQLPRGGFSLSHIAFVSKGCVYLPLEPSTELCPQEASVIQVWVSLHLDQRLSYRILTPSSSTKSTSLPLFDFAGFGYLQGCGRDLHPGRMGTAGPGPEGPVPGGDAGDLWASGLTG